MLPLATLVTLTGESEPGEISGKRMRKVGKFFRHNIAYATPYGPAVFAARVAQDKIKKARAKAAAKKAAKRKADAETAAKRAAAATPKAQSIEPSQPEEEMRPPEAPAEETPAEETPAEETPAEETPAEEAQEAAGIYGAAAPIRALAVIRPPTAPAPTAPNATSKIMAYIKKNPAQIAIISTTGIFLIFTLAKGRGKKRRK